MFIADDRYTRKMIDAIHNGTLKSMVEAEELVSTPVFGLRVLGVDADESDICSTGFVNTTLLSDPHIVAWYPK